jgi:hypothetical protein
MLKEKLNKILSALAEQEKEHGYFVLAKKMNIRKRRQKFHRVPSLGKEHGYFVLATPF